MAIFMVALGYDGDEIIRQQQETFNADRKYPAKSLLLLLNVGGR